VDDLASGSNDPESALELTKKIKTRLSEGGFNMRKWLSNTKELMTEFQNYPQFSESPQQPSNLLSSVMEEDQGYIQSQSSTLSNSTPTLVFQVKYGIPKRIRMSRKMRSRSEAY
jgi:hypothetical protein